jgi:hypothetical protein
MHKVFYCDNGGEQSLNYQAAFRRAMTSLGYQAFAYSGLGAQTRQSNIDREIRDDFFDSDQVVVLFNREPRDSWAMAELDNISPIADRLLVFATSASKAQDDLAQIRDVAIVADPAEFEQALKNRLEQRL